MISIFKEELNFLYNINSILQLNIWRERQQRELVNKVELIYQ